MKKTILTVAVALAAFAGVASAAIIPINDAIDQFEWLDLANTIDPIGLSVDSPGGDAWSVTQDVNTAMNARTIGVGGTSGNRLNINARNVGDLYDIKSANIGYSLVAGQEYQFSIDLFRGGIGNAPDWVTEVYADDGTLLLTMTNEVSARSTWENKSGNFTASVADAGKDVYFRVLRSSVNEDEWKGGAIDNLVLQTVQQTVPEPSTLGLVTALGAAMMIMRRRSLNR